MWIYECVGVIMRMCYLIDGEGYIICGIVCLVWCLCVVYGMCTCMV